MPFQMQAAYIEGLSAHTDHPESLDWMSKLKEKPERIFIVHGEKQGAEALQEGIMQTYSWDAEIPKLYDIEEINYLSET